MPVINAFLLNPLSTTTAALYPVLQGRRAARRVPRHSFPQMSQVLEEPCVGARDALGKRNSRRPAQGVQPADIQEFAWSAVRLGGIEAHPALDPDCRCDQLRQLPD